MVRMKSSFFIFCVIFFGCSIFQDRINNNESHISNDLSLDDDSQNLPLIKMRKTPCFGQCPYFEVSIFSNGNVQYEGFKFVEMIGLYKSKIDVKKIAQIEDQIRRIDFFSFNEIYDSRVTDLPSIIIEVNLDGKNHKVKGRYKMPETFKLFAKFIDEIITEIQVWNNVMN